MTRAKKNLMSSTPPTRKMGDVFCQPGSGTDMYMQGFVVRESSKWPQSHRFEDKISQSNFRQVERQRRLVSSYSLTPGFWIAGKFNIWPFLINKCCFLLVCRKIMFYWLKRLQSVIIPLFREKFAIGCVGVIFLGIAIEAMLCLRRCK